MLLLQSVIGFLAFPLLAWLLSESRRHVSFRTVAGGIGLQLLAALVLLKIPLSKELFFHLNHLVNAIQDATTAGTSFVFGYLGGGKLPFQESFPGSSFVLALQALPLILVASALSSLLFYWRIMPWIVRVFSELLQKTMGVGGALGVGAAANIFVGMIEAPLFIRPYLEQMSRSEIFGIMTCGMATIAGTVMVLYAKILQPVIPDAMGHLLIASVISAPAAITIAGILIPDTGQVTGGDAVPPRMACGSLDAVVKGTTDGVQLLINITAMLIVFIALVHLVNQLLGLIPFAGDKPLTLEYLLGVVMRPVCWLMGIPWKEAAIAGSLMGVKTITNELLAYLQLAGLPADTLSPRSSLIMIYALCGFANFGSLGIMIGGLGSVAPGRKKEIVELGMKSILAGTLATCMTGAVIGIFYTI